MLEELLPISSSFISLIIMGALLIIIGMIKKIKNLWIAGLTMVVISIILFITILTSKM